jgi:hypothetical protein
MFPLFLQSRPDVFQRWLSGEVLNGGIFIGQQLVEGRHDKRQSGIA